MDFVGVDWLERISNVSLIVDAFWSGLASLWKWLFELPTRYPQLMNALFGLGGWALAIWKYWEGREVNLFRKFERMIEGLEAQLIKARTDVLDVITRPGPGLLIRPPIFAEKPLREVLARHKWPSAFSKLKLAESIDQRLERAVGTCDHKVTAHLGRLAFFRQQIAAARLIQGALAAGRAAKTSEEHAQRLDQEALDRFRAVLAIPGHAEDVGALELIAHQLARLDPQSQLTVNAHNVVIEHLQAQPESPARNRVLARAKRSLAILRYPNAHGTAQSLLNEAIQLLTKFGPPRDRDFLELADCYRLEGIAHLKLDHMLAAA
jgi:hypothetical protein